MTPDVNVLLAALREDHPHHESGRAWLTERLAAAAAGESLIILPMVAMGVLRIATHPKIFRPPTPTPLVLEFLERLIGAPGVEYGELGREWPTLRRLVREHSPRGNAVPDVWIAAAAQTLGTHLVAFDRDFKRYLRPSEFTLLDGSTSGFARPTGPWLRR
jgi:toxin-antitoxin system PIN domain toxin